MAIARRRFVTGSRRFSRKRQGAWNGQLVQGYTTTANAPISWYLWDDVTSSQLNMAGKGVHQRTHYQINFSSTGANPAGSRILAAWYVAKFSTDQLNNVPSALIYNPLDAANPAIMQKDLMDYQFRAVYNGVGTPVPPWSNEFFWAGDIKAKRKLDDTDALLFTFCSSLPMVIGLATRTYFTW